MDDVHLNSVCPYIRYGDEVCIDDDARVVLRSAGWTRRGDLLYPENGAMLFGDPQIRRQNNSIVIQTDILASAFYLLSRYDEIAKRDERDQHGRFPGKQSIPFQAGFIDRPVIDEYGRLLRSMLREVGADIPEPKKQFRVSLTHDVDTPWIYPGIVKASAQVLKRKMRKKDGLRALAVNLKMLRDPADTFDYMRKIDNAYRDRVNHEVDIIYFFMAGGSSAYDGRYNVEDRRIRKLIQKLVRDGAIIGLHVSYEAGEKPWLIQREKAALEEVCGFEVKHSRHHYLRVREPEDLSFLEEAGIEHDYSMGYADVPGFRNGVAGPFRAWDHTHNRPGNVICHPLNIMDRTLSDYLQYDVNHACQTGLNLKQKVKEYQGEFSILWHNNMFQKECRQYNEQVYCALLNERPKHDHAAQQPMQKNFK